MAADLVHVAWNSNVVVVASSCRTCGKCWFNAGHPACSFVGSSVFCPLSLGLVRLLVPSCCRCIVVRWFGLRLSPDVEFRIGVGFVTFCSLFTPKVLSIPPYYSSFLLLSCVVGILSSVGSCLSLRCGESWFGADYVALRLALLSRALPPYYSSVVSCCAFVVEPMCLSVSGIINRACVRVGPTGLWWCVKL